ncbi:hypothetical protein [Streptomyces sp. ST2-7A]|uniref:hypothetical protein n=1 Tax=Streptomyces sp. ST2-7A TaxID=2907214 RepID=UPI001F2ECA1E|nr:hypothetical protein [Streptomyces sp. ST2-7A]MCE7078714.1 hypothetical protein [Streptomyces sp. ST2-7A]
MDFLRDILLALHIIGIAALLGGFLFQMKAMGAGTARMLPGMWHGALTMLVTGVALVGLLEAGDGTVNHIKIGIKLLILIVVAALVYLRRDDEAVPTPVFGTVGLLTIANIFIAVLW